MLFAIILALSLEAGLVETISFNPPTPHEQWDFVSVLAYGDDEDEILGQNMTSIVYANGAYYLLDASEDAVVIVTAEGDFQRINVGGPGPGECFTPMTLILWPDPSHVAMFNPLPPLKLESHIDLCPYTLECSCPKTFSFGQYLYAYHILYKAQENIFALNTQFGDGTNFIYRLCLLDYKGSISHTLFEETRKFDPQGYNPLPLWYRNSARRTFGERSLFFSPRDDYLINEYSLQGELLRVLQVADYPRRKISSDERDYHKIEGKYAPDIHSLFWVDDRLLVLNSNETQGQDLTFDSFHFGDEVTMTKLVLPGIKPSPSARYFWIDQDTLAIVYGMMQSVLEKSEFHYVEIFQRRAP